MSPCYICSRPIEDVKLDPRDMKTRPCSHCESIIAETAQMPDDEDDYEYTNFDDEEFPEDDYEIYPDY